MEDQLAKALENLLRVVQKLDGQLKPEPEDVCEFVSALKDAKAILTKYKKMK